MPEDPFPALRTKTPAPSNGITTPTEGNPSKPNYASKISHATGSNSATAHHPRESVVAKQTTHNGIPAVIFKSDDYYGIMADECRLTIVGRFSKPRPQIEKIRSKFKELFPIKGSAKIGVFDNYNVFLDFTNEDDFNTVWFRRVIEIDGLQMWLQKWSPDFKPDEDIPIAPVWVLLPGIPFHLHTWHYVKQIVSSIGTPLALDAATCGRTRPSMAKVRVEIDLLKNLPDSIYVGSENEESPLKGYYQKIEYDNIPKFCRHCKKLGHNIMNCRILERIRNNDNKDNDKEMKENDAKQDKAENSGTNEHDNLDKNENGKAVDSKATAGEVTTTNKDDKQEESEHKGKNQNQHQDGKATGNFKTGKDGIYQQSLLARSDNNRKKKKKKKMPKKKSKVMFKPAIEFITGRKKNYKQDPASQPKDDEKDQVQSDKKKVISEAENTIETMEKSKQLLQADLENNEEVVQNTFQETSESKKQQGSTQELNKIDLSTSLASEVKNQKAIQLVIDLNRDQTNAQSRDENNNKNLKKHDQDSGQSNTPEQEADDRNLPNEDSSSMESVTGRSKNEEDISEQNVVHTTKVTGNQDKRGTSRQQKNGNKQKKKSTTPLSGKRSNKQVTINQNIHD